MSQWEAWFWISESNGKAGCRKPSCLGTCRHHLPFRKFHQLTWMSQGWAQPWNPQSPTVSLRLLFPSRTNSWHRTPTEWAQNFSYCLRLLSLKWHAKPLELPPVLQEGPGQEQEAGMESTVITPRFCALSYFRSTFNISSSVSNCTIIPRFKWDQLPSPPIQGCTCDSGLANQQPHQDLCCAHWQRDSLLPPPILNAKDDLHLELLRKTSPQSEANRELINRKREHRFLITYFWAPGCCCAWKQSSYLDFSVTWANEVLILFWLMQ